MKERTLREALKQAQGSAEGVSRRRRCLLPPCKRPRPADTAHGGEGSREGRLLSSSGEENPGSHCPDFSLLRFLPSPPPTPPDQLAVGI